MRFLLLFLLISSFAYSADTGCGVSDNPDHPNSWIIIGNDDWPVTQTNGDDHRTFTSNGAIGINKWRFGAGYDMITDKVDIQREDQLTISVSHEVLDNLYFGWGYRQTSDLQGQQLQTWVHNRIHNPAVKQDYGPTHDDIFAMESYEIVGNIHGIDWSGRLTTMLSPRFIESYAGLYSVYKNDEGTNFWIGPAYCFQKQLKDKIDCVDFTYKKENGFQVQLGLAIEDVYFVINVLHDSFYGSFGVKF